MGAAAAGTCSRHGGLGRICHARGGEDYRRTWGPLIARTISRWIASNGATIAVIARNSIENDARKIK